MVAYCGVWVGVELAICLGVGTGCWIKIGTPPPVHACALGIHPLSLAHSVHCAHSYSHPDWPPESSTLGSSSLASDPSFSSTLNSSILQSLTSTTRQTQSQPQTLLLAQSQTYSQAQRQQHSQQTQTHLGQIQLPPGFMYQRRTRAQISFDETYGAAHVDAWICIRAHEYERRWVDIDVSAASTSTSTAAYWR